jgi:hypothetical protein
MSSQGPPGIIGYTFKYSEIRDAADYTAFIRQQRTYTSYLGPTAPVNNRPDVYGCWFRLQYLLGRHKHGACSGSGGICSGTASQIRGELGE